MADQRREPSLPALEPEAEKPSDVELAHARLQRFLNPNKPLHWSWGEVGYPNPARFPGFQAVIYRPEIYELPSHRYKEERVYGDDGIALVGEGGKARATREGGVWEVGNPEEFAAYEDVLRVAPGRFAQETLGPELVDALRALAATVPEDRIPMARHYATLVVRAILEFGWEPFLTAAAMDEKAFGKILDLFGEATLTILRGWAQIDRVPLVYLHDDIAMTKGLIFRPAWYREYVFPWYRRFVDVCHAAGKKVLFVSDGNYLPVLDDILATGMDGLAIESSSMDPAEVMARAGSNRFYLVGVDNRVMDFGTPDDVYAQVRKLHRLHQQFPAMWMGRGGSVAKDHRNAIAFARYSSMIFGDGPESR